MSSGKKDIEAVHVALGARIRLIRETLGVTQEDLAKRLGLVRTSLVNIEAGRQRMLLNFVDDVARELHTSPKQLMKGIWW